MELDQCCIHLQSVQRCHTIGKRIRFRILCPLKNGHWTYKASNFVLLLPRIVKPKSMGVYQQRQKKVHAPSLLVHSHVISALQSQVESMRTASGAIKNFVLNFQGENLTKHTHMYTYVHTHTPHYSRQNFKVASKIPGPLVYTTYAVLSP